jgi:hypothetical protein
MAHRRKTRSTSRSFRSIFLLIVGGLLLALLLTFSIFYFKTQHSLWAHRGRINFVWGSQPARLVSLIPGQQLIFFDFPNDSSIIAAQDYGEYPLSSLWRLAVIEHQPDLVAASLQQFLGVPVSAWITSPACSPPPDSLLTGLKSCLTQALHPAATPPGNLSRWQRLVLYLQLRPISLAQVKYLDLGQLRAAQPTTLPDGQTQVLFDQDLLDADLEQQFFDPLLIQDHLTAEVVNTTNHANLANHAARLISHLGIPVLSTSNSPNPIQTCVLNTSSEFQSSATVNQLLDTFHCQLQISNDSSAPSDLQLLLGEDFWQSWQGPR